MPDEPEPNFEEALTELERVVESLERGEPDLTAALAKYEHGVRLLRLCHRLLDQAEQSVALLTGVDGQGNPLIAPFDATSTLARELGTTALTSPTSTKPNPDDFTEPASPAEPSARRIGGISPDCGGEDCDPPF